MDSSAGESSSDVGSAGGLPDVGGGELETILSVEQRGVIIDFWGTWCQPCRTLRPHLESLADRFTDRWRMVAVHVESHPEVAERYAVTTTPTLVFVEQGTEVHRIAGATPPSAIATVMAERV